VCEINQHAAS
jgi:hypothetical protein